MGLDKRTIEVPKTRHGLDEGIMDEKRKSANRELRETMQASWGEK